MRARWITLVAVVIVVLTAAPSWAQWTVTPYLGVTVAGDAEFRRGGPGVSGGYFGDWLGFEFDVQRYNHFFKDKNVDLVPNNCGPGAGPACIDLNTDAWSFMGNVVVPIRLKTKWHLYATAGAGVIHPWIEGPGDQYDVAQNDVAFNVGGGVVLPIKSRVQLRGGVQYVRALVGDDAKAYFRNYGFVRATLGVTFSSSPFTRRAMP